MPRTYETVRERAANAHSQDITSLFGRQMNANNQPPAVDNNDDDDDGAINNCNNNNNELTANVQRSGNTSTAGTAAGNNFCSVNNNNINAENLQIHNPVILQIIMGTMIVV